MNRATSIPDFNPETATSHLAAIVESSEDAIISKTLEGIVLTWNAGAEHVYGYPAAEAIGQSMTFLLPSDRPDEEAKILSRIERGERVDHFDTVRRKKDGDLINVSITISPIRDATGRIVAASHVARNITESKHQEERLRETQKLESLGVLAGGIAHDFNNLLTGILGNASLAAETVSDTHLCRRLMDQVIQASERAAHLTRQLLAYAGKGQFVIKPINISHLVRELSDLLRTSIPKSSQLRFELTDDLPLVMADASQLQQLMMNMVINGAEAIGTDRSGTVTVKTDSRNMDEQAWMESVGKSSALESGTYVTLEVRDNGCGMDEETLARMFDPFFTTKFTGRGLGLAAFQGIVRGHKGAIKVDSRLGQGTTFLVFLPATDRHSSTAEVVDVPGTRSSGLILVIDDEALIRSTAKSMLEHHGYSVVVAENGEEGCKLFETLADNVSAVLLDLTMPVLSGEEAFHRMMSIKSGTKVILSSGYSEAEAVRTFAGHGLSGFVQKPYTAATLLQKVASVLQ